MKKRYAALIVIVAFLIGGIVGGAIAVNLLCVLWFYQNFVKKKP